MGKRSLDKVNNIYLCLPLQVLTGDAILYFLTLHWSKVLFHALAIGGEERCEK
jgi:hypothetical protein